MRPKRPTRSVVVNNPTEAKKRPDPLFKQIMTRAALEAGLKQGPTELQIQQASNSDMLLLIPPQTKLDNTMFDFFRQANVLEFKSANDPLSKEKFQVQLARVYLWSAQNPKVGIEQVLNVIISARYPREFLKYSAEQGCSFEQVAGREWLWKAHCGWQKVTLVVCEMLPIEPLYINWLLFAAPTTNTWHATLQMLARQANIEMLEIALSISPKEFEKMSPELEKIYDQYPPEEKARLDAEWFEVIKSRLPKMARQNPAQASEVLAELTPEQRLAGLKPEERLSGLKPEERIDDLSPEQQEQLLELLQKRRNQAQ